jgi:hypothetical protein
MSHATPTDSDDTPPANAEQKRLAFNVVDAVDNLHGGLGALRAVQQLAATDAGPDSLVKLQRSDLAALIGVISSDLEAHCVKARDAAALAATAA